MTPFDLHTHTRYSDGDESPAALAAKAKALGLSLIAVTDHDTVGGVAEAVEAGRRLGVRIVPGVELSTRYRTELHILGLGVDTEHPALLKALHENAELRDERNAETLQRLSAAGMEVSELVEYGKGATTRLAIAEALTEAGYADSPSDAFRRFLDRGTVGYVPSKRIERDRAIELIHEAGGLAVAAHPYQAEGEPAKLISQLVDMGLDGIEAFYPHTTAGQQTLLLSLARRYRRLVTCGSDYHGSSRPANILGSTWRELPDLAETYALMATAAEK